MKNFLKIFALVTLLVPMCVVLAACGGNNTSNNNNNNNNGEKENGAMYVDITISVGLSPESGTFALTVEGGATHDLSREQLTLSVAIGTSITVRATMNHPCHRPMGSGDGELEFIDNIVTFMVTNDANRFINLFFGSGYCDISETQTVTEATCTTRGILGHYCRVCDYSSTWDAGGWMRPHNMSDMVYITVAENCQQQSVWRADCLYEDCDHYAIGSYTGEHEWSDEMHEMVAPTCFATGRNNLKCITEGCSQWHWGWGQTVNRLMHNMSDVLWVDGATCSEEGWWRQECLRDGCEYYESGSTGALGCDFNDDWVLIQSPTCVGSGIERRGCLRYGCEEGEQRLTPSLGGDLWGSWGDWSVWLDPTCDAVGWQQRLRECTRPNCVRINVEDIPLPALGHAEVWSDWTINRIPTCMLAGERQRTQTCTRDDCELFETDIQAIATLPHTWTEWHIITPPQIGIPGERMRTCTNQGCNIAQFEEIPPIPLFSGADWDLAIAYLEWLLNFDRPLPSFPDENRPLVTIGTHPTSGSSIGHSSHTAGGRGHGLEALRRIQVTQGKFDDWFELATFEDEDGTVYPPSNPRTFRLKADKVAEYEAAAIEMFGSAQGGFMGTNMTFEFDTLGRLTRISNGPMTWAWSFTYSDNNPPIIP